MRRDFGAAALMLSIQGYKALGAVWPAAAGAEFSAVDKTQASRPAGAGAALPLHVRAWAGVLGAADAIALTPATGALPN